jgi:predicted RNase H-like nuclease (RuvC/YqgF family)
MTFRIVLSSFALAAAALCFAPSSPAPLLAQGKKDNDAALRAQINRLQGELRERDAKIKQLQAQLANLKRDDKQDEARIKQLLAQLNAAKKDDKGDDAKIKELQKKLQERDERIAQLQKAAATPAKAIVHSVIFKIKDGGDEAKAKKTLDDAAKTLAKIEGVRDLYIGKPAAKGAKAAESDYQFGMVVILDNAAALQRFLDAPANKALQKSFEKPTVYDFQK